MTRCACGRPKPPRAGQCAVCRSARKRGRPREPWPVRERLARKRVLEAAAVLSEWPDSIAWAMFERRLWRYQQVVKRTAA